MFPDWHQNSDGEPDGPLPVHVHVLDWIPARGGGGRGGGGTAAQEGRGGGRAGLAL